jgi:2-hydroxychromene-2-carboxylate isomerase
VPSSRLAALFFPPSLLDQTYLALALLKRHEKEWNLDIHLEPVSIGYLFQAAGNKAPLTVPNKGKMMVRSYSVAC